jgi:hypothetical protein
MPNYYTKSSFIIPCTKVQAACIEKAAELISEIACAYTGSEEERESLTFALMPPGDTEIPDITRAIVEKHMAASFMGGGFITEVCDEGVAVMHDESIDIDEAFLFASTVLEVLKSDAVIEATWANTCGKQVTGAFSGGAARITRGGYKTMSTDDLLAQLAAKSHAEGGQRLMMVQGREYGDDDDTAAVFTCQNDDDAVDIFLREHLALSDAHIAAHTDEDPVYFIICEDDYSDVARAFVANNPA